MSRTPLIRDEIVDGVLAAFATLPGSVTLEASDSHADFFLLDRVAIRAVHDISPAVAPRSIRYGAVLPVSRGLIEDSGVDLVAFLAHGFDRSLRPWKYPDRYLWPTVDLFPRLARIAARWRHRTAWFRRGP